MTHIVVTAKHASRVIFTYAVLHAVQYFRIVVVLREGRSCFKCRPDRGVPVRSMLGPSCPATLPSGPTSMPIDRSFIAVRRRRRRRRRFYASAARRLIIARALIVGCGHKKRHASGNATVVDYARCSDACLVTFTEQSHFLA